MTWLLEALLEPLQYDFMRLALLVGLLVGIICPVVGAYLIVQRIALLGDVIAHAVLPGLAIAHFLGLDLLIGAFGFGLLSTFFINWVRSQSRVSADAAMAITFASFFSLGIMLLSLLQSRLELDKLLFGDVLSVTLTDLGRIAAISSIVLVGIVLVYKELLFFTFDRVGAEAMGLPVAWLNLGLMAAITLTIIAGMKTVGVVLVIALMVGPAATAFLLVRELHWMMVVGALIGVSSSLTGLYLSYYLDLPSGPAIALTVFAFFLLALLFSPSQGILVQTHHSHTKD